MSDTYQLITKYYDAFNEGRLDDMVALLSDDVKHYPNQGTLRTGKDKFREFNAHMETSYRENLTDIIIFVNKDGTRAAAEFVVNGTYQEQDEGLPPANGQKYKLPAASFFEIKDGKITRVTTYYNLQDWIAQVS